MNKTLKRTALATLLVVALGSTAAIAADGGVPEALGRINSTLNALVASVGRLTTSIDQLVAAATPSKGPVVLTTSAVRLGGRTMSCLASNVGTTPITVQTLPIVNSVPTPAAGFVAVQPTHTTGISVSVGGSDTLVASYCRFATPDAAASLRASMVVYDSFGLPAAIAEAR